MLCRSKWSVAYFQYNLIVLNVAYKENKLFTTSDHCSKYMLNFDFVEKGVGIVSTPHLVCDFSRKMFHLLYSINRPSFIVWLPLLLEILVNMLIEIVCFPGCDAINIKINPIFLIKLFFYLTENPRQKFKFLQNEKNF